MMSEQIRKKQDTETYIRLSQYQTAISGDCNYEYSDKRVDIVKRILERNHDVAKEMISNSCSTLPWKNFSILGLALFMDIFDVFELLIKLGAEVTFTSKEGITILHEAIELTSNEYLKMQGQLKNPYIDCALSAQVISDNAANLKNKYGISHFHIACMTNNIEAVVFFLDRRIDIHDAIKKKSPFLRSYTPLHIAARYCAFETTKVLLDRGANKSVTNAEGLRPIHLLIQRNMKIIDYMNMGKQDWYDRFKVDFELNNQMIKLLYEKSLNSDNIGLTSFHIAAMLDTVMVEELLEEGVYLHQCVNINSPVWPGYTALHFAAHFNIATLSLLLDLGGNILIKDAKGTTPFDLCLQRYEAKNIYSLIITQPLWKEIEFLDNKTKLIELILAMENENTYRDFLSRMPNKNTWIPSSSPLWPGYTALHIAVTFLERNRSIHDLYSETTYKPNGNSFRNCSQEEEELYLNRIKICLDQSADVTIQDAYGSSAVHVAFSLKRTCVVGMLLQSQGKIVNPVNQDGLSHLHIACAVKNEIDINNLLINADLNAPVMPTFSKCSDNNLSGTKHVIEIESQPNRVSHQLQGSTPLLIAIDRKNYKVINSLIEHGANLFVKGANGITPVHAILGMPSSKVRKILYPQCLNNLEETLVNNGLSLLHVATVFNNIEVVKKLLNLGANVQATAKYNSPGNEGVNSSDSESSDSNFSGYTPLHFAVKSGHPEVAELLLQHGANVLAASDNGTVPLYCSLMKDERADSPSCTKILVNALRLDIALQTRLKKRTGLTLLHLACHMCDVDLVRQALIQGDNVNARTRGKAPLYQNLTPLQVLMKVEHLDVESVESIMRLLINHGADVMVMNAEKKTPVHVAYDRLCLKDHPHVVVRMLGGHRDYNVNPTNPEYVSHFHVACIANAVTQVEGFLRHGVDVNRSIDHFHMYDAGRSPLSFAIEHRYMEIFNLLMKYNANVRVEDSEGQTPLHFAAKYSSSHVILERIIWAGADIAAENIYAETPFEMLLGSERISKKKIELFLIYGCRANVFNPISDKGFIGKAFVSCRTYEKKHLKAFETIMHAANLTKNDEKDRNAIHNIVSVSVDEVHSISYVSLIGRLEKLGCDINHRDQIGKTPLHTAIQFRNLGGIIGLLKCGADLDIPDNHEELAFDYSLKPCESIIDDRCEVITKLIMMELYKQQYIELRMSNRNADLFAKARQKLNFDAAMFQTFLNELKKMKNYEIESSSINLHDFLSETGAVAAYPHMMPSDRQAIDDFFKNFRDRLHVNFPEWSRFCLLQYRKARERVSLLQPAKLALYDITNSCLYELCYVAILRLLSNEDLKCLILSGEIEEHHSKEKMECE